MSPPATLLRRMPPTGYAILRPRTNGAWVHVRRPSARLCNDTAKLSAERLKICSRTNTGTARAVELVGANEPVAKFPEPNGVALGTSQRMPAFQTRLNGACKLIRCVIYATSAGKYAWPELALRKFRSYPRPQCRSTKIYRHFSCRN